jgi:hypothetical protein
MKVHKHNKIACIYEQIVRALSLFLIFLVRSSSQAHEPLNFGPQTC